MADGEQLEVRLHPPLSFGESDITGIGYEPWHYRYVGKAAAADIYRTGVCLEEYLSQEGPEAELAPAQTIRQAAPASGSMETAPQGAAAI